jgi:SAM-dependent methyltransferase
LSAPPHGPRYEAIPCNLCGGSDFDVVFARIGEENVAWDDRYRSSSHSVCTDQIVSCRECGLVYVNPRPLPELINQGYAAAVDETYTAQASGRIRAFRKIAARIARARPGTGRLLDVGAAAGYFLLAAREAGFTVEGIELSRYLAARAKAEYGLEIHTRPLTPGMFPDDSFDVVTMLDVLEHVDDPAATVRCVRDLLVPGGLYVLSYPDFGSVFARLLGRRWWFLLSVHLFYFTRGTIRRLLETHGFEVLSIGRHYPTLPLGYLSQRLKVYSRPLGGGLEKLFARLRIDGWIIPYYASQTLVFSRLKS